MIVEGAYCETVQAPRKAGILQVLQCLQELSPKLDFKMRDTSQKPSAQEPTKPRAPPARELRTLSLILSVHDARSRVSASPAKSMSNGQVCGLGLLAQTAVWATYGRMKSWQPVLLQHTCA